MAVLSKKTCVYVVPFKINSWQLPLRAQVFFARDFCSRMEIDFSLPKSELLFSREFEILDSILINKYTDIMIFSEALISHENALNILKRISDNSIKLEYMPKFHLTFSDESIDLEELIMRIEKILRNKKYCMTFKNLKKKLI